MTPYQSPGAASVRGSLTTRLAEALRKYGEQAPAASLAGMPQPLTGVTCGLRWLGRITPSWRLEVCCWLPILCFLENKISPDYLALMKHPCPAGVTAATVGDLSNAGFAGVAVIGAVWEAAAPLAAYRELQMACSRK